MSLVGVIRSRLVDAAFGCPWLLRERVSRRGGLAELAHAHGFELGALLTYRGLLDRRYRRFVARNFDRVACSMEMKPVALVDREASRCAPDGMPVMCYREADRIVAWARANGLKVRGHVLVYHHLMPDWFFREGYADAAPFVGEQVARARLACYIDRVIRHFENRSPGTVDCWDVVNEALGGHPDEYAAGDPRHLRIQREGVPNCLLEHIGPDYVEWSFLKARETVDALGASIRLVYNDFDMLGSKKPHVIDLVRATNSLAGPEGGGPRRLIDDVGIQGYLGVVSKQWRCLDRRLLEQLREAVLDYAAAGVGVEVTELTVRNYDESALADHAAYCGELFELFAQLAHGGEGPLRSVTVWGVTDVPAHEPIEQGDWNPHGGLLTGELVPKQAFEAVRNALRTSDRP